MNIETVTPKLVTPKTATQARDDSVERRNGGVGRRNDFIVEKRDGNVERRNENVVSVDRGASSEPLSTRNQGKFVLSMFIKVYALTSVTRKKSPNVYKSCPKMISLGK